MRKSILAAAIAAFTTPAAFAGSVTSAADISINGGVSGGYFYSTNTGNTTNAAFQVSDFLVELSGKASEGVSFVGSFGALSMPTVYEGGVSSAPAGDFGFQYGWLSVAANDKLTIDAGMLATNVGYEIAPTYANASIVLGAVWNAQPVYYPGLRATYDFGGLNVYAEASADSTANDYLSSKNAWAVGVNGGDKVSYAVSYFNYNDYKGLLDVIVSSELAGVPVALNFDYQTLVEAPVADGDDSAFGLALYVSPSFDKVDLPMRLEYLSDGDSGIYGNNGTSMNSGFTFTITPTYMFGENAFVRAELSFVSSDNKIFADDDGNEQDNKTSFALQAGYTF